MKNQHQDFNVERFKTRLTGKCCVVFICLTQIIARIFLIFLQDHLLGITKYVFIVTSPFPAAILCMICFEYILFKKIGSKVMDYSKIIDIILLIIFTGEWITIVCYNFAVNPSLAIGNFNLGTGLMTIITFIDFAWRTLFLLLLVQSWKLIIIPPIIMMSLLIAFGVQFSPDLEICIVIFGLLEMVYLVLMLYFLDRFKWKEIFMNTQQERWMQINEFVLHNIPENIVILDLEDRVNFVSNNCQSFMQRSHLSQNPKDLFRNIVDLHQRPESESPRAMQDILEPTNANLLFNSERFDNLQDLIENFKYVIKEGSSFKERQFVIFDGKLKSESLETKSIEIKISFIQQYGKEHIILIIRDTTQRDLLVALEDKNKYKDQLLASVSHELRAPLNGNINLVESALHDKNVPERTKERFLQPALRSSRFLLHLINDILDMSQIKAQKLRLIFKNNNLQETLKDTLQLVELQAKRKGIDLSLEIHENIPEIICTDHVRLSQIILNLLGNAIKFTQKGSIILSVLPIENSQNVKIRVQDSGIGMIKEDIKKLFSDFTHIEFSGRAEINPTGVGLGLNIAYNLAKLLGPSDQNGINVESALNVGSTFSFIVENKDEDILIKKISCSGVPEEIEMIEPKSSSRLLPSFSVNPMIGHNIKPSSSGLLISKVCKCPRILIVDDNPFNTMAFEAALGSLYLKCDSAFDGRAAIDKILSRQITLCGPNCKPYGVVFMDQEMPGMTGSETVQEIRGLEIDGRVHRMKIIGATAHGSCEEVEKFMQTGIDSCIQKPITAHVLQRVLEGQNF